MLRGAQVQSMPLMRVLASAWDLEPSVLLGSFLLLAVYLVVTRFRVSRCLFFYLSGVAVLLLSLISPLDALGDEYLFSAHMLQHLLLVLVVPPLLLLGIPREIAENLLRWRFAAECERRLANPIAAWFLGIGAVWVWHIPALYNATLENESLHVFEHLCFLVTSVIFWWPVLAPVKEHRLSPTTMILYLASAGMANTLLGIVLAFTPLGLFPAYLHPADTLGILPALRDWGLTPEVDQRIAGLLMWFPGGIVYVATALTITLRWLMAAADAQQSTARYGGH
jgi:cytochrome c oxidase assembly factor CtaG